MDILGELKEDSLKDEIKYIIDSLYYEDSRDYIVSRGEYLNGKILAAYLGYEFLDAKDIIFLDGSKINEEKTEKAIREKIEPGKKYVIPGFYGNQGGKIGLLKEEDQTTLVLSLHQVLTAYFTKIGQT